MVLERTKKNWIVTYCILATLGMGGLTATSICILALSSRTWGGIIWVLFIWFFYLQYGLMFHKCTRHWFGAVYGWYMVLLYYTKPAYFVKLAKQKKGAFVDDFASQNQRAVILGAQNNQAPVQPQVYQNQPMIINNQGMNAPYNPQMQQMQMVQPGMPQ